MGKKKEDKKYEILNDRYSRTRQEKGLIEFDLARWFIGALKKSYPRMWDHIKAKHILRGRVESGQALTPERFDFKIYGMTRFAAGALLYYGARRRLDHSGPVHPMDEKEEMALFYNVSDLLEFAKELGRRLVMKSIDPLKSLSMEVEACFEKATDGAKMAGGYKQKDIISAADVKKANKETKKPSTRKPTANRDRGRKNFDYGPYRDPDNDAFVPEGWCIFKFSGLGCRKGANCDRKHSVWTAEELANAKRVARERRGDRAERR